MHEIMLVRFITPGADQGVHISGLDLDGGDVLVLVFPDGLAYVERVGFAGDSKHREGLANEGVVHVVLERELRLVKHDGDGVDLALLVQTLEELQAAQYLQDAHDLKERVGGPRLVRPGTRWVDGVEEGPLCAERIEGVVHEATEGSEVTSR